jgi:hypothetical protein
MMREAMDEDKIDLIAAILAAGTAEKVPGNQEAF